MEARRVGRLAGSHCHVRQPVVAVERWRRWCTNVEMVEVKEEVVRDGILASHGMWRRARFHLSMTTKEVSLLRTSLGSLVSLV